MSADALLAVINDILDFSRIEAGKFELDPIDFKLRDTIGDIADAVALRAHQKGLELIADVEADVPYAASLPEALAALRVAQESGKPFHLVLTDAQMPDADGFSNDRARDERR